MKLNVKLLRKIQEHILEEPRRFIMGDVIYRGEPGIPVFDYDVMWEMPKCGTTACIAGWAILLSRKKEGPSGINGLLRTAAELLRIDHDRGGGDSDRLFHTGYWPQKYQDAWETATTPRRRARVAVQRIDHFIATRGAE